MKFWFLSNRFSVHKSGRSLIMPKKRCKICGLTATDELNYGPWKSAGNCTIHYFCAVSFFYNVNSLQWILTTQNQSNSMSFLYLLIIFFSFYQPIQSKMVLTMRVSMDFLSMISTIWPEHMPKRNAAIAKNHEPPFDAVHRIANEYSMLFVVSSEIVCISMSINSIRIVICMLKSKKNMTYMELIGIAKFAAMKWVNIMRSQVFHRAAIRGTTIRGACNNIRSQRVHMPIAHRVAMILMVTGNFYRFVEFSVQKKMLVGGHWHFNCNTEILQNENANFWIKLHNFQIGCRQKIHMVQCHNNPPKKDAVLMYVAAQTVVITWTNKANGNWIIANIAAILVFTLNAVTMIQPTSLAVNVAMEWFQRLNVKEKGKSRQQCFRIDWTCSSRNPIWMWNLDHHHG